MSDKKKICLLIPIYDDWDAVSGLIQQVSALKLDADFRLSALIIDDGSTRPMPAAVFKRKPGSCLADLSVIELARNLGHQSAIAVGLGHIAHEKLAYDAVIVMDGDGEDHPKDILGLISAWKKSGQQSAVFAERARRSEGLVFRFFYQAYRLAYRVLTGTSISMGNFSLLPKHYVSKLILYPELWRHYPATVKKSKLPVILVPSDRAERLEGRSKMNFYNLILHGLGAITVHSDIVGVRSLVAVSTLLGSCFVGILGLLYLRFFTHFSVPVWTSSAVLVLTLIALQFLSSAIIFSFLTLAGRSPIALNPARNYQGFVKRAFRVY
jgi:glycosyltransferase involved in cell wall biosynthesis